MFSTAQPFADFIGSSDKERKTKRGMRTDYMRIKDGEKWANVGLQHSRQ